MPVMVFSAVMPPMPENSASGETTGGAAGVVLGPPVGKTVGAAAVSGAAGVVLGPLTVEPPTAAVVGLVIPPAAVAPAFAPQRSIGASPGPRLRPSPFMYIYGFGNGTGGGPANGGAYVGCCGTGHPTGNG